ncbi:10074_t:CDS:2 [Diversispora eburnea]|uniref:10074_t:CDS:1 n=1 Tax=Diversispora eburnea TaxID=1213867 RepID=A0A9N8W692_9GLOM|nr:10074_t:CDS:2 [Diversispora eburnea]
MDDELIKEFYGLPFGTLGLIIWTFSFYANFLLYCNIPPISVWLWGKPYKSQSLFPAFFAFVFIAGPTAYTCYACRQEWRLIILAIGQISPWAFKTREKFYRACGGLLSILTGLCGWVGFSVLIHEVRNTERAVNPKILSLFQCLATITHLIGSNIILAEITEIEFGIEKAYENNVGTIDPFWLKIMYALGTCLSFVNF